MEDFSRISEYDLYLFHQGRNFRSYQFLGAHLTERDGEAGVHFAVWAPHVRQVRVVGDFNRWQGGGHVMQREGEAGIWSIFISGLTEGSLYKYEMIGPDGRRFLKADPYAFAAECRPGTASRVAALNRYAWQDNDCLGRRAAPSYDRAMLIYEVHLGSWRRRDDGSFCSYRELAEPLATYAADMGYTHIELLPLAEHPFDGSWGYQATGYYAVTSRYGSPEDFMYFVDCCHRKGLGVIMDWVPGHFCKDSHGLQLFDGTPLYEGGDAGRAENTQWGTLKFDFGRPEVWSFLIANALFWFDVYHIDGLRVDAVANMLYLDYGRSPGQWRPNQHGGKENLDAVDFLRKLNETVFLYYPYALMIAEESTAWPLVSRPTFLGGLGFNYKWNMGWMNDMLRYMGSDPMHRQWVHHQLTFSLMYAFSENFILPLSHDEVVHGKKSLLDKMPGDYWQKFANLRLFYGYMMAHPGKKLLFMGGEFGQFIEWNERQGLDWHLLGSEMHAKLARYVRDLNLFYRQRAAFWEQDYDGKGFQWIDCQDYRQSIVGFVRKAASTPEFYIVVCNFTPVVRESYRIGVPGAAGYQEVFNSDWEIYGGSGQTNGGVLQPEPVFWHNCQDSVALTLPPLAVIVLAPAGQG